MELSFFERTACDGFLIHADAFGGVVDHDGQVFVLEVLVEEIAQLRLRPDEMDTNRQSPAGEDGPPDLRFWSFVGTDGVERDVDEHGGSDYLANSLTSP